MRPIIIEGIVGGLTVVIGVVLAEMLARARRRREQIEAWVEELSLSLPRWLIHFTGRSNYPNPNDPAFPALHESVIGATSGIRFGARWPMRGREKIKQEVEDLSARITAVYLRYFDGHPTTSEEILYISVNRLREAVLGTKHEPLEHKFEKYVEEGIPTDEDD